MFANVYSLSLSENDSPIDEPLPQNTQTLSSFNSCPSGEP